ncbi:MAG TPA: NYN domain-containing protein [Pyrinomonadaceae bacterium]|nr:NYN domain-containing protein [Pyrinomonadaceae bacterium]
MPYLVDGNNVMAQRVGWHRDKPRARRGLMDELAHFARRRRVTVTVVFDGAPEQHFGDGSSYKGVRVFYGERGSNADERIKRLVEDSRERRTLVVVTSDRALADYVRRCGAQVLRSGEFRRKMEDAATDSVENADAVGTQVGGEVNEWMRYFGVAPDDDEE